MDERDLKKIGHMVKKIKSETKELIGKSEGIQAIECNARRILASAKMLEINISDLNME